MLLFTLAACKTEPDGYEVDKNSVVLEVFGPNPVLRGAELKFVGQNLDKIRSVILPVGIEILSSDFKEAGPGSFKVKVPIECEPGVTKWSAFVIGVAVGGITIAAARRAGFKKVCAKLISAGLQLKDDASAFVETVKEDAEDIAAEIKYAKKPASTTKKAAKAQKA